MCVNRWASAWYFDDFINPFLSVIFFSWENFDKWCIYHALRSLMAIKWKIHILRYNSHNNSLWRENERTSFNQIWWDDDWIRNGKEIMMRHINLMFFKVKQSVSEILNENILPDKIAPVSQNITINFPFLKQASA